MIYSLDLQEVPKTSQVGGKGRALIETSKAGFPVPELIILSVDYLEPWLSKVKNSPEWVSLMKDLTIENCTKVQTKALLLTLTPSMKSELEEKLSKLNSKIFAVRSSSPEEDLENTSFAGMYETYLGVTENTLENHIVQAFSSCFDYRVMAYKNQHSMDLNNTSIAIIVQKQIASDVSGVGFSLNPLNNSYDEVVINASFGLGEAIVSGIVTPDHYVYDFAEKKIIEKKINKKEIALCLKESGGIEEKENTNKEEQALTDLQIVELSNLIKKCESYYGKPMDTEWAYENGKLYLLQSRPITTYLPFFEELLTKPGKKKKFYMDFMIMSQGFDEPMSVLGLDLWSNMIAHIKGGMLSPNINGSAPALYGRQYMSFTALQKLLGAKNTEKILGSYDSNIKKIFKDIDLAPHFPDKKPEGGEHFTYKMFMLILLMLPGIVRSMFANYKSVIEDYNKNSEKIMDEAKLFNKEDCFKDIVSHTTVLFAKALESAGMILAGVLAQNTLQKMFKGEDIEKEVIALSMDLEGNPTSAMGYLLFKIASYNEFQKTTSKEEFIEKIESRSYKNELMKDYDEFMDKYSCRVIKEIDVASKRIYEDVGILYDKLVNINIHDSQITTVKEKRKESYDRLLQVAKEKGIEKRFVKTAKQYQATFGYREHPKYLISYLFSILHKICLEIAEPWVKEGRIENTYQIFDLHADEVSIAQKDPSFNLMAAREKNLEGYKKVAHIKNWPLVIDSRGKIYQPKLEIKDGDIIGEPIAPGKVIGKAKVLRSPYEKPLYSGEILIARATEPSWTPIFINAAGVIMEIGGPLQHGGIIAREYGIPCVSGLIGIMDIIKDGDLVEVDGSNGIVKILNHSE